VLISRKRHKTETYFQRKTNRKSYVTYRMAPVLVTLMTLKVIHWLQAFSSAIRGIFVQHFTRFQLTACSRGPSATAGLLVYYQESSITNLLDKPLAYGSTLVLQLFKVNFSMDVFTLIVRNIKNQAHLMWLVLGDFIPLDRVTCSLHPLPHCRYPWY